jgi:hypothetical protein
MQNWSWGNGSHIDFNLTLEKLIVYAELVMGKWEPY